MTIDDKFILVIILISSGSILIRTIFDFNHEGRGMLIASLAVLTVSIISFIKFPQIAGTVSLIIWGTFLILPMFIFFLIRRAIYRNYFAIARRLIHFVRYIYPFYNWNEYLDFIRANELANQGQLETARVIFECYKNTQSPFGILLTSHFYRLSWQWAAYLEWIETQFPADQREKNPLYLNSIAYHLRALGETGNVNAMLDHYHRHQKIIGKEKDIKDACRLFIFAFSGRKTSVATLLEYSSMLALSEENKLFWLASAALFLGEVEAARSQFTRLLTSEDFIIRQAAEKRLSQPLPSRELLSPEAEALLVKLAVEVNQERQFDLHAPISEKKAYLTYSLIVLNLLFYTAEIWGGGSENIYVLYRLGALEPSIVLQQGEWWRLINSIFLHYGHLHLLFNMLGIFVIGPYVELHLKKMGYLLTYFISGIGANIFYIILFLLNNKSDVVSIAVGASGAIMGLLGATGALMLHGWWVEKAKMASRHLLLVLTVIVLQSLIDVSFSEISFVHHISGVVIGFTTALLWILLTKPKKA